jgi:hypothetical protein
MSSEHDPTSQENNDDEQGDQKFNAAYQAKLAVHERDRYTCISCRENFEDDSHLDVDHIVPEGKGGPNTIRNKATECRRCHEAKHGEREHAPTVRFVSTGDMIQKDFRWFRHFWREQFPALSEVALSHRIKPKIDLADDTPYRAWHIPIGDLRRLDEVLANMDDLKYAPMGVHHYM